MAGTSSLRAEVTVPPGGIELTSGTALKVHADPAHATASQREDGGWKLDVSRPDEARPFLAQVSIDGPAAPLAPGETVLAVIKARAAAGASATVEAKLQLSSPPYTMAANTTRPYQSHRRSARLWSRAASASSVVSQMSSMSPLNASRAGGATPAGYAFRS